MPKTGDGNRMSRARIEFLRATERDDTVPANPVRAMLDAARPLRHPTAPVGWAAVQKTDGRR